MAWYRTGSVAVTNGNSAVTGAGTLFAENCEVGDAFNGPDGRRYEVINIASNTVISISPNYIGATASGQAYSIEPTQDRFKMLADRAAAVLSSWENSIGLAEGALQKADNLAALTNKPQARANLGLGSAATVDLPSGVSALGTAAGATLSDLLTKAGNLAGLTNAAQARVNLGVVSAVEQEVLNTGNCTVTTNANGTSYRFPNGLQICRSPDLVIGNLNQVEGQVYRTASKSWTFPQAFVEPPAVSHGMYGTIPYGWTGLGMDATTNTGTSLSGFSGVSHNSAANMRAIAVGRWK